MGSVFLEGPEGDSIRVETCWPNAIMNIIKFYRVSMIHHCIFMYVCVKHFGMANIKFVNLMFMGPCIIFIVE